MLETKFRLANVEIEGQGIEAHYAELSLMESNLLVTCLASACAGLIGRTICHPIDTVKAQVQMSNKDIRLKDLIHTIWKSEGIAGFYRGIGAVTIGGVPGVCVYITTYEKCKHFLQQRSALFREQPFLSYLFSGMAAEATCCALFIPVDVIKERLQVQSVATQATKYNGSLDAFRCIVQQEGVRALYKGYWATLFSYGPFSSIYFLVFEEMKRQAHARLQTSDGNLPFSATLISSAIAGSMASFITNPLDVAKLRFQVQRNILGKKVVQGEVEFQGFVHTLRYLARTHGMRALFRGSLARVMFHTPSTAITMALYDHSARLWSDVLTS